MALTTKECVFVVFLWSLKVVLGQGDWGVTYSTQSICVLKGSTVEMSCSYTFPSGTVTSTFWYSEDTYKNPVNLIVDSDYTGRVKYHDEKYRHTLTITDLRETDSAEYKFSFITDQPGGGFTGYPGVTLTVTGLQVEVSPKGWSNWKTLTCRTTCPLTGNPTYIWFKNGQQIYESSSPQYKDSVYSYYEDSYSCSVKGHEDRHSPTVCLQAEVSSTGRSNWKTLTCRTTCPLTGNPTYIWYKNGQQIDESSSPQYKDSVYSNYEDSYSCSVKGGYGSCCWRVTYTKRRICVLKGSSVDITCSYTHPSYYTEQGSFWFTKKDPVDLCSNLDYLGRLTYRNPGKQHTMTIKDLRESDSTEYKFRLLTNKDKFSGLPGVILKVTDVRLEMVTSSVSEGGRLTLLCKTRCTLDHIPEYIWYKNGRVTQPVTSSNRLIRDPVTGSNRLIRDPVSRKDAGRYSCGVKGSVDLNSTEVILTVNYAPKNTSVSVSPSGEIMEGSSVTLTCSSDANPPVNKYTWYKKTVTSPKASGQSYSITNITSEDSGEYYCEAESKNGRLNSSSVFVDVHYGPKNTSVSVSPSGEIVEGSSVTLTCSSDANPPVNKYTWYKKTVTSPKASGQSYSITNITSEDSGEYYCEFKNGIRSKNSTDLLIIVAVKQSLVSGVVGITVVVLVLIPCLFGFIWFRKKSSQSTSDEGNIRDTQNNGKTSDSSPVYDNVSDMVMTSTAAQTADTDNQDDLHYASVHYSSSIEQEEPLYSTIQSSQPQKQEEDVQYAALKFNCPSAATRLKTRGAEEEPSMLYSTVNIPRNKRT